MMNMSSMTFDEKCTLTTDLLSALFRDHQGEVEQCLLYSGCRQSENLFAYCIWDLFFFLYVCIHREKADRGYHTDNDIAFDAVADILFHNRTYEDTYGIQFREALKDPLHRGAMDQWQCGPYKPIEPHMLELCETMNANGFQTLHSCHGHVLPKSSASPTRLPYLFFKGAVNDVRNLQERIYKANFDKMLNFEWIIKGHFIQGFRRNSSHLFPDDVCISEWQWRLQPETPALHCFNLRKLKRLRSDISEMVKIIENYTA